jgi:phosphoglycerol transferase MdoB-like AlkP superfamily enzyme
MFQYFINNFITRLFSAFLKNFLLLLALFMLTRIVFTVVNAGFFPGFSHNNWWLVLSGSLLFDVSAIVYVNLLFILLFLFPLPADWRTNRVFVAVQRWVFVITNGIALIANVIDTVYFPYTQRRTTINVFREFSNENNISSIFMNSMLDYWYLSIFALLLIIALYVGFRFPKKAETTHKNNFAYWISATSMFLFVLFCGILGIRGGIGTHVHPIAMTNAAQYVMHPMEASVILNTPFSVIRSSSNKKLPEYKYYATDEEAEKIFPTLHTPIVSDKPMQKLNVVVIIMESMGKGYIGGVNKKTVGEHYQGFTPFLDSLITKSLVFENSIANGHKSIDALPSILASVPSIIESYFLSDYGNNDVNSLAGDLKKKGYYSAFFHGAPNGSLGLWAFAKGSGFDDYYGLNEYGNKADFDGTWAIWDEPFFEFYASKMSTFKQPFVTAFFSATSHNPFVIPPKYKEVYKEESLPIYKCIRYSDNALRTFFGKAKKTDWFKNTLFVITGDHTNMIDLPEYQTNMGYKSVPVIFYCPGKIQPQVREDIVQQIDIKPSVLGFLGYDQPYIAFGRDVFSTTPNDAYAVYENNFVYEYITKDYLLQFDGQNAMSLFKYNEDKGLQNNLLDIEVGKRDTMQARLKAMLQIYQSRMRKNNLIIRAN